MIYKVPPSSFFCSIIFHEAGELGNGDGDTRNRDTPTIFTHFGTNAVSADNISKCLGNLATRNGNNSRGNTCHFNHRNRHFFLTPRMVVRGGTSLSRAGTPPNAEVITDRLTHHHPIVGSPFPPLGVHSPRGHTSDCRTAPEGSWERNDNKTKPRRTTADAGLCRTPSRYTCARTGEDEASIRTSSLSLSLSLRPFAEGTNDSRVQGG